MEKNLVGYLLNALDPETHCEVANYLRDHPEAQERLGLLRQGLAPLAADRDAGDGYTDPPRGLALRALARVAEHRCRELPRAPVIAPARKITARRGRWRLVDSLVAAMLLLTTLGLLLPVRTKAVAYLDEKACAANQKEFREACLRYADLYQDQFPNVADQRPRDVAGISL